MSDDEMVSVPKALLARVLETAQYNCAATWGEFGVGDADRAAEQAEQDAINELRRAAGIPPEGPGRRS